VPPQFIVELHRERRTEHDAPKSIETLLEWLDVALVSLPAVPVERFPEQECGHCARLGTLSLNLLQLAESLAKESLQALFATEVETCS